MPSMNERRQDGTAKRSTALGRLRPLLLVPPLAAVVIAALVAWKLTRPPEQTLKPGAVPGVGRQAPLFELYDQNSQIVRLARYAGRHKLLLVFFDGRNGPDHSALLTSLRDDFPAIHETGAVVLAISGLRPAEHRAPPGAHGERTERAEPFPFPLLSDINDFAVHRSYGAFDTTTGQAREAVFVVDRTRAIRAVHFAPFEPDSPQHWVAELRRVR